MKKYLIIILILISIICFSFNFNLKTASADELNDTINEQLENIDLKNLENFFNEIPNINNLSFNDVLHNILNGEYQNNENILQYFLNIIFNNIFELLPIFISIITIAIILGIIQNVKSSFLSESTNQVVNFICFLSVVLLLSTTLINLFEKSQIIIENIAKLNEIMSPIILTLMIASGGTVSASVYKPAVLFFSDGVISLIYSIVIPLIILMTIFSILSFFSKEIKLNKFSDFICGLLKWIFGIVFIIYSLFNTINGISSAVHDGISIKAAKFAISNSVPIVGGFLKDGFDVIVAGSILIKNSIGIAGISIFFIYILSNVLYFAVYSLLLKLTSAFCETLSDTPISSFMTAISRSVSYLIACVLMVSFMFFMSIILMIFSANSFI